MRPFRIQVMALILCVTPVAAFGQGLFSSSDDEEEENDQQDLDEILRRLEEVSGITPNRNGDVNADGKIDISDALYLANWLFSDGPAPVALQFGPTEPAAPLAFDVLRVALRLEVNVTDNDVDLAFGAKPGEPIRSLTVYDPDGDRILHLQARSDERLSVDKVLLENESASLESVRAAYPAGDYLFQADTLDGRRLAGIGRLSHDVPLAPVITTKTRGENLVIRWTPVDGAFKYGVEINDDSGFELTVRLDSERNTYTVPCGLLTPSAEYEVAVIVQAESGNLSIAETSVTIPESTVSKAE